MTPPRISVIVPARGPAPGLESCLEALAGQTLPPHEVIVVDNGLEGGRMRIARALPGAVVVEEGKEGSYAARNAGLRAAAGEVLAFTDADCVPHPSWLAEASGALLAGRASVVAGPVEIQASLEALRSPAEVLELAFAFPQERYVKEQGFGVTANLVARRKVFSAAGSFREDLLSGGDFEWGRRAASAGFPTLFASGARVRHPARREAAQLLDKERRVTGGICHLARTGEYEPGRLLRTVLWTISPPLVEAWTLFTAASLGPPGLRFRALSLLLRLRWTRLRVFMAGLPGGAS